MASMSSHPNCVKRCRTNADEQANLLVFCCLGLLIDVVALLTQRSALVAFLSFALIAAAAPVAAMVAVWLADHADADRGGNE
ncbi:hypothetical protein JQ633_15770 [Bradyrhizobium tropiciagri]|uniref:hypothetical protein n=1 Tax=Bradyrhizobium tropiciagri TaxID=312253 RepID=UPI001BAACEC2|nr:hypothetical protein [Bradyrhizobium tropiciagri]MBR0871823.1 hypothetical protein [Bradyrhizobium tropiciagri]